MLLELDARYNWQIADSRENNKQSIFVFGLYRAGSSLIGVAANEFAQSNNLVPVDVFQNLYDNGVSPVGANAEPEASIHLADKGRGLAQLCDLSGYVFHGFREVPEGFAEAFSDPDRAIIFVRDPRDIGISHYFSIVNHTTANDVIRKNISRIKSIISNQKLETFITSDEYIKFIQRICFSYEVLIKSGVKIVKYEELFVDGSFNNKKLLETLSSHFASKCVPNFSIEVLEKNLKSSILSNKNLKNHKTSGSIELFKSLSPCVMKIYTEKLEECISLLGYKK